jgi:hypothetical protein
VIESARVSPDVPGRVAAVAFSSGDPAVVVPLAVPLAVPLVALAVVRAALPASRPQAVRAARQHRSADQRNAERTRDMKFRIRMETVGVSPLVI